MKNYVALEVNNKKETLGSFTIKTPNELLLAPNTDSILNNRIFEEFIDEIFWLTVNELVHEVDKKINNVLVTFINNDDELICSILIDKLKPKRGIYRMQVIDWEESGYTFKYVDEDNATE